MDIFRNFKLSIEESLSENDFEIDFNNSVLIDVDYDDYEKINIFVKQTLSEYPKILSFADKPSKITQNKYLKQLFIRYMKEQNYILAFSTLMMKNPIFLNDLDSQYNKKLTHKNLYERIKQDIEEANSSRVMKSEKSKQHLARYLEKEIFLILEDNCLGFNEILCDKSREIFELEFKNIVKKFIRAQNQNISIEEFWDTY